ncbi:MAG TPA: hypothetical protein VLS89_01455, partial [Candidatus Nanopelagicales bacterium]|nr:hypothetical protein [Candidatus Nanopelagicales bacterium]
GPQDTVVGNCIASTARAATLLEPYADETEPPDERLGKICQRLGLAVFHRLEAKPKGYVEH